MMLFILGFKFLWVFSLYYLIIEDKKEKREFKKVVIKKDNQQKFLLFSKSFSQMGINEEEILNILNPLNTKKLLLSNIKIITIIHYIKSTIYNHFIFIYILL